jgi:hypothetical protein
MTQIKASTAQEINMGCLTRRVGNANKKQTRAGQGQDVDQEQNKTGTASLARLEDVSSSLD